MNKHLYLLTTSLLLLTACSQSDNHVSSPALPAAQEQTTAGLTYKDYVAPLTPISFDDLAQKMARGEAFILFLGRETCPYCQQFVPKLYEVLQDQPTQVYYFNTEDKSDQNLQAFRDKFGIATVPNLSYYEGDQLVATLEEGSQASRSDISALLAQLTD